MRVDQMERGATVVDFTARLLTGLVRTGNIDALHQALPEALPWTTFLPEADIDTLLSSRSSPVTTRAISALFRHLAPPSESADGWAHLSRHVG